MSPVFISHSSHDADFANRICAILEKKGVSCWIAPRDVQPGQDYGVEILKGIEESRAMILILSEEANKSKFVKREVERAVSNGKTVLPLRTDNIIPSKALELFISGTHWIDVWTPPIEQYLDKVIEAIDAVSPLPPNNHQTKDLPISGKPASQAPSTSLKKPWKLLFASLAFLVLAGLITKSFFIDDGSSNKLASPPDSEVSSSEESDREFHERKKDPLLPLPQPVKGNPPEDIAPVLTLLKGTRGQDRSNRLHQYESKIPETLTIAQIGELLSFHPHDDGDNIPRFFRNTEWLAKRVSADHVSSYTTILAFVYHLHTGDRSRMLDLLWSYLPDNLTPREVMELIEYRNASDPPDCERYLTELKRFHPKLSRDVSTNEITRLVYHLSLDSRSKGIAILTEFLPEKMSVSEFQKMVALRQSSGGEDLSRYQAELKNHQDRLPEKMTSKDFLSLLTPLQGQGKRDWIIAFAPRLESIPSAYARKLTLTLGSSEQAAEWKREIMEALLPRIR